MKLWLHHLYLYEYHPGYKTWLLALAYRSAMPASYLLLQMMKQYRKRGTQAELWLSQDQ